jgi:hypothetical protein
VSFPCERPIDVSHDLGLDIRSVAVVDPLRTWCVGSADNHPAWLGDGQELLAERFFGLVEKACRDPFGDQFAQSERARFPVDAGDQTDGDEI